MIELFEAIQDNIKKVKSLLSFLEHDAGIIELLEAIKDNIKEVKSFLEHDADIHAINELGNTDIHAINELGNTAIHAINELGNTALIVAAREWTHRHSQLAP
jgi:ankyrin repeat protein